MAALRPTPRPYECIKCNEPHKYCLGHNKAGKPCGVQPANGADVCRLHGGHAPQVIHAAAVRVQEHEARRLLEIEGFESISDPYSELASLAGEIVKLKDVLREKVQELTTLKDVGGDKVATQIDVIMSAYERALDRCERILTNMSRLNLDAKIAELNSAVSEASAAMIRGALDGALSVLSLAPEDRERVLRQFGNLMRTVQEPAVLEVTTR